MTNADAQMFATAPLEHDPTPIIDPIENDDAAYWRAQGTPTLEDCILPHRYFS